MELYNINTIKELLSHHGFSFSKALGQNFLIDPGVCPAMAENCGIDDNTGVIEVGPGIGVLTKELAQRAKKVVSIELDTRLLPVLAKTLDGFDNIEVINEDVLKIDLKKLIEEHFEPGMNIVVCANLPYYITSPVIMKFLEEKLPISAITVMIQKEVADRLCAEVGSRDSGAVTVCVQYYSSVQRLFEVGKECFMPSPKVDSTVIRLDIRKEPPIKVKSEEQFFKLVKAAFSMRRKTALNSISNGMGISKERVLQSLEACGFEPNVRAEKLTMQELAVLCESLSENEV